MAASHFAMQLLRDNPRREEIIYRQIVLPRQLSAILDTLKKDSHAHIFLTKVNKREAPNYYDVIKHPMDLGTVGRKIHLYRDAGEFKADLDLIWSNCLKYNTLDYFIKCANEMRALADSLITAKSRVSPAMIESVVYNGITNTDGKSLLRRTVAKYLRQAGFYKGEKSAIDTLTDVTEYMICQDVKRHREE